MYDRPEPVLTRAFWFALVQLVVLAGVAIPTDVVPLLVEILLSVGTPALTLVMGWLARRKVTPVGSPVLPEGAAVQVYGPNGEVLTGYVQVPGDTGLRGGDGHSPYGPGGPPSDEPPADAPPGGIP